MGNVFGTRQTTASTGTSRDTMKKSKRHSSTTNSSSMSAVERISPIPDPVELERRFTELLSSMDLPPDKVKLLRQYDAEKKWDLVCDQGKVQAKDPPSTYLAKLETYMHIMDPKLQHSKAKRTLGDYKSTQVLRDLEISLRTNHIEWVKEFLNEENNGLDVLVNYLNFQLVLMRRDEQFRTYSEDQAAAGTNNGTLVKSAGRKTVAQSVGRAAGRSVDTGSIIGRDAKPNAMTLSLSLSNLHDEEVGGAAVEEVGGTVVEEVDGTAVGEVGGAAVGEIDGTVVEKVRDPEKGRNTITITEDDIHVAVMCLRAIMNNKLGFNMVFAHAEAINCITLSLNHNSLRTKALVLELLAAVCLVQADGHDMILEAFDHFKLLCEEQSRFETLMNDFMNYEEFNIDFMVACMQFINIVVHSVDDMNFRVHLQYEFTKIGLDDYLEKLKHTESEQLLVQISAYRDNMFDVQHLMEEAETKNVAVEQVAELENELSHAIERFQELENESMAKICELESAVVDTTKERDMYYAHLAQTQHDLDELRKQINEKDEDVKQKGSLLQEREKELESLKGTLRLKGGQVAALGLAGEGGGAPPAPGPPPPPGQMAAPSGAMTIKRRIQTKYRLPMFNWIALKPQQLKGTVFNELDDDKLLNQLHAVTAASRSVRNSARVRKMLEIILVFGNYMNSNKRGGPQCPMDSERSRVYIMYTQCGERSQDKKVTLLNFIAHTVKTKFPELLNFDTELRFIEKAAQGTWEGETMHMLLVVTVLLIIDCFHGASAVPCSLLIELSLRQSIFVKKVEHAAEVIVRAINNLDLSILSLEMTEILLKLIPKEDEIKAYRQYEKDKKPLEALTEEDKLMFQLTKVERLLQKLQVMSFIGNFDENLKHKPYRRADAVRKSLRKGRGHTLADDQATAL
ncbi:PREDICTED: formin-like protein CG32138 [Priapulus caudatus]|uniref:Formin-like protein CG32138 n=1 Tax=Priapulus caudatus TaxID=37621 RepID=A0ABM1ESX5_PRICU|nr:PREDICTED: formin-like protein CG32138 [Priapulus caudatus]